MSEASGYSKWAKILGDQDEVTIACPICAKRGQGRGPDHPSLVMRREGPDNIACSCTVCGASERAYRRPTESLFSAAELDGRPVPERREHVAGWIPARAVTRLGGDGGAGKSIIALQLAIATTIGGNWCGRPVRHGRVLYVGAEDDKDELHRRLVAICTTSGIEPGRLCDLHLLPLAGEDAVLVSIGDGSSLKPTSLFVDLEARLAQLRPALLILDTLADLFGGDENDRRQARQFVGLLAGWARKFDMAVLLLAHPSLSGLGSGRGTSGSTAWRNSVRASLTLQGVTGKGGEEVDSDLRLLSLEKANYGRSGATIRLRWQRGVFVPINEAEEAVKIHATNAIAERVFCDLLAEYSRRGVSLSQKRTANNNAPKMFVGEPKARTAGLNKGLLDAAMARLLLADRVRIVKSEGPPSRRVDILVLAEREEVA